AIAFRPRSASELVDAAFQILRGQFGSFALLTAIATIPSLILSIASAWTMPSGVSAGDPTAARAIFAPARLAIIGPIGLIAFLWMMVAFGALVAASSDAYLGRPVDPASAFQRAFARTGKLIGGHLLAYLAFFAPIILVAVGIALAIPTLGALGAIVGLVGVPGALVWMFVAVARYFTITAVLTLEDGGATAALGRSSQLSKGSRGRVLGVALLVFVITFVVAMVASVVAVALPGGPQVAGAITYLLYIPLYPLFTCAMTAVYYDLRIRKEGYDIELMAQELGEGARQQPAY
ncbi:MAG: hypothetical protein ACJ79S_03010, partial [Gemmatimonadaceae bacterium]